MDWEPKFTGLVYERRLWMSWLPMLEDKFEGKTPQIVSEEMQKALTTAKTNEDRAAINDNMTKLRQFAAIFYPSYFVSCWSMNEVESDLMWRSYTNSGEAVVVQTTFERLEQSIPKYLDIGQVRYIDYNTQGFHRMNMFEWPMHKRKAFTDDREVRVLATALVPDELGGKELRASLYEGQIGSSHVQVCAPPIDLSLAIEAIRLHPRATAAFALKASEFCRVHGLPIPERSELSAAGSF